MSSLPLGDPVDFTGAPRPQQVTHAGHYASLRPLHPAADAERLYAISHEPDGDPTIWTYMYDGPYPNVEAFRQDLERQARSVDPLYFTVLDHGCPAGVVSYLAIVPEHGTIEVGNIWFGPGLKQTTAATEAIYLLARHAFDELGYRRLEWKCNALNEASRKAALRFGFLFEGIFAEHRVVKGRNRDTAWFAITDARWPRLRDGFEAWLAPVNFDESGQQRRSLRSLLQ